MVSVERSLCDIEEAKCVSKASHLLVALRRPLEGVAAFELELAEFCSTSLEGDEDWRMLLMAAVGKSSSTSGSLLDAH